MNWNRSLCITIARLDSCTSSKRRITKWLSRTHQHRRHMLCLLRSVVRLDGRVPMVTNAASSYRPNPVSQLAHHHTINVQHVVYHRYIVPLRWLHDTLVSGTLVDRHCISGSDNAGIMNCNHPQWLKRTGMHIALDSWENRPRFHPRFPRGRFHLWPLFYRLHLQSFCPQASSSRQSLRTECKTDSSISSNSSLVPGIFAAVSRPWPSKLSCYTNVTGL
jgi:hypothetical protein